MSLPGADQVHRFWFGPVSSWTACVDTNYTRWFEHGKDLDAPVREAFEPLLAAASTGMLDHWLGSPRGALSLVITLDQFPRHIHRGSARAFSLDAQARVACEAGIRRGYDLSLSPVERSFFYLPLEHAEDRAAQERCVSLMSAIDTDEPGLAGFLAEVVRYAELHRDIVARFGRFPHRNALLGRTSTEHEQAYLNEGGARFGQ